VSSKAHRSKKQWTQTKLNGIYDFAKGKFNEDTLREHIIENFFNQGFCICWFGIKITSIEMWRAMWAIHQEQKIPGKMTLIPDLGELRGER